MCSNLRALGWIAVPSQPLNSKGTIIHGLFCRHGGHGALATAELGVGLVGSPSSFVVRFLGGGSPLGAASWHPERRYPPRRHQLRRRRRSRRRPGPLAGPWARPGREPARTGGDGPPRRPGGHSRHANAGRLPAIAAEGQARTEMNHGQHQDDTPITDTDIEAMADEAERGYDVDTLLRRRRGGRPPLGSAAATVDSVRLDPELKRALLLRAAQEHVSVSEVIRRAIGEYLQAS